VISGLKELQQILYSPDSKGERKFRRARDDAKKEKRHSILAEELGAGVTDKSESRLGEKK